MSDKTDGRSPMDVARTHEGLVNIFNYYDDHPLTKADEGQRYFVNGQWMKSWYSKTRPDQQSYSFLDTGEIERDNGLELDENGTVKD
jgi:hypothetical protein